MDLGIEGFTDVEYLGRGGFGTVYRVNDDTHGRRLAVKVLPATLDDSGRRQFDRERRAMGALSGVPGIGVVHTSGYTASGEPYIVMELLAGGSLAERIERGPVPVAEAISVGVKMAEALDHAHAEGVLHLDLKPENILFDDRGNPKLVDFGIAKLMDDDRSTATIRATPAYAAPEVLEGHPATPAADIYSLAVTLFTTLAGVAPFAGDSMLTVLRRIAVEPVPVVDRADVPIALRELLRRAMDKSPDMRPATMAEFAAALRAVDPTDAPPVGDHAASAGETQDLSAFLVTAPGTISEERRGFAPPTPAEPAHPSGEVTPPPGSSDDVPDPAPSPTKRRSPVLVAGGVVVALLVVGAAVVLLLGGDDSPGGASAGGPSVSRTGFALKAPGPDEAAELVSIVPDGSPELCFGWEYRGFPPGADWRVSWEIDRQPQPDLETTGALAAASGPLTACIVAPEGVPAGLYEATWWVEGSEVESDAIYVGGSRESVTLTLQNASGTELCEVNVSPSEARAWGANVVGSLGDGETFRRSVASGRYDLRALDCNGAPVWQALGVSLDGDRDIEIS